MNEILKLLNELSADELDSVIMRATIILEKKRKDEERQALLEKERIRQEQLVQDRQRQKEIAELERKLQELKNQRATQSVPEVQGNGFVMYEAPKPAPKPAPQPAPGQTPVRQPPTRAACPHCGQMNTSDSLFCGFCGKKMTNPQSAPQPAPQPTPPRTPSGFAPQAPRTSGKVSYADASLKQWVLNPGEVSVRGVHEILLHQPEKSGKYIYSMEVTNQRILFTRQHVAAAGTSRAFGLLGALATEIAGGGFKPWAEIPLTAIKSCGLRDKKDFVIEADEVFVMKNKKYDQFLPELVEKAKRGI